MDKKGKRNRMCFKVIINIVFFFDLDFRTFFTYFLRLWLYGSHRHTVQTKGSNTTKEQTKSTFGYSCICLRNMNSIILLMKLKWIVRRRERNDITNNRQLLSFDIVHCIVCLSCRFISFKLSIFAFVLVLAHRLFAFCSYVSRISFFFFCTRSAIFSAMKRMIRWCVPWREKCRHHLLFIIVTEHRIDSHQGCKHIFIQSLSLYDMYFTTSCHWLPSLVFFGISPFQRLPSKRVLCFILFSLSFVFVEALFWYCYCQQMFLFSFQLFIDVILWFCACSFVGLYAIVL